MKVYCINLDRHARRMERMKKCLNDVHYERLPAVDGRTLPGLEKRDYSLPGNAGALTRYECACVASHRLAWGRFLADGGAYGCMLEDDVFLSPDFSRFINDETWIPAGCKLVKIETFFKKTILSQETVGALNRSLAEIRSLHQGTGGYILNREGANILLTISTAPDRPVDLMLFDPRFSLQHGPVLQLIPALCVQAQQISGGFIFEELRSSIQLGRVRHPKSVLQRIKAETSRPFRQLAATIARLNFQWRTGSCRRIVPYA